ncbi:hypothetical protein TVAG_426740 [Trichomonas vaginalis G3]|uniref:Lunapark zinc ribbon domain-containing protein n=1 Tax=Trichomonas vaginalis (strain ATCC PRA-98 / G3) TaxID=412133 RepID=A2DYU0_TRIV3|nr:integral membrane zinc-ribbon metal-binding protein family [Trichomonas vaginalis G3]EAY14480.1 hypothetical protein TVAG_426740 [Trichomonas vaginalis G3]KAI5519672.1 integral membrane zinc-ribbon metal-binding protein family [Trichomonas vaginalis G3]|eukprot:XP_001326703.1 hypothetical protein [Trichomonas vaginalis G3]
MGLFGKKDIANEIDDLNIRIKILEQDLRDVPLFYDSIFYFLLFLSLAVACFYKYIIYALIPSTLTILIFLLKKLRISRIKSNIQYYKDSINKKNKEIDNNKEIEQYKEFLTKFRNNANARPPPPKTVFRNSFMLRTLDKLCGTYTSNPKALICKKCGFNNGLADDPKNTTYICASCGSTNKKANTGKEKTE